MASSTSRQAPDAGLAAHLIPHVERALEALWLLAAVLVPLIFVSKDFMMSEAVNAYVEVPKTTALRTLVGMMVVLLIVEWVIKGGLHRRYSLSGVYAGVERWVVRQPSRWVIVAATVYVVVTIITTFLSTAFWRSLWGEVPGQFGYSAYTTVSYFILFATIATHLKTRAQLGRLLGVLIVAGAVAALYGIAQHYGGDPLSLGETGSDRITVFMANPVFTGAFLLTTTLLTLGVGLLALDRWGWKPLHVILWIILVAVQFLALYWTGSRGAFVLGWPVGLLAFAVLSPFALGPRVLPRRGEVLLSVATGLVTIAVLAAVAVFYFARDEFLWELLLALAAYLILAGLAFGWRAFAKTFLIIAAGLAIWLLVIFLTPSPSDASIRDVTVGRGLSYRIDIWDASISLVANRTWFEYEDLWLSPIRPLIGYGPEMFKYTFPLETPIGGLLSHAHNFFLHHWVEQGVLGFLASAGLVVVFLGVGGVQLWRHRDSYSTTHKWLLVLLLATILGRVAEMMVGVARESDLVVFWVLLAIFAALPSVMESDPDADSAPSARQRNTPLRGTTQRRSQRTEAQSGEAQRAQGRRGGRSGARERRRARRQGGGGLVIGRIGPIQATALALVSAVVIFVGWLTWDKNIDYAWAAHIAASARDHFQEADASDVREAHRLMSQASSKAPDVPIYYNNLAVIYNTYDEFLENRPQAQSCADFFGLDALEDGISADGISADGIGDDDRCILEAYRVNLGGFMKNPDSLQVKRPLAESALKLARAGYQREDGEPIGDEAIRYYVELAQMRPGALSEYINLVNTAFALGRPQDALAPLDRYLLMYSSGLEDAAWVFYLQGLAYQRMDDLEKAAEFFERSIELNNDSPQAAEMHNRLSEIYETLGDTDLAEEHRRLYEELNPG